MRPVANLALFAYGSLVSHTSASLTLGRAVDPHPVRLDGYRRRFSQCRDNRRCEKTFARVEDGSVPRWILGLNLEGADSAESRVNGALIAVSAEELARLDRRELRYDRRELPIASLAGPVGEPAPDRLFTYLAKAEHHVSAPPAGAVIVERYAAAVEEAFDGLGPGQLDEYRRTTLPYPVALVACRLIADRIPQGNPREW